MASANAVQETPGPDPIPTEDLLAELQAGATVLGRAPTRDEMRAFGEYSPDVYNHRFGGWFEALEQAGVYVPERRRRDARVLANG